MTASDLLADLQRRGVTIERHGDRLRYYPIDRVTEAERLALLAKKAELLRLLADPDPDGLTPADVADLRHRYHHDFDDNDRAALAAEAAAGDHLAQVVLRAVLVPRDEPSAWRIFSHRLGRELWVCKDLAALRDLEPDGLERLPAVLADDVERLRGLDDAMLGTVLDVLATFPGARVQDAVIPHAPSIAVTQ